jgi:hypothetical protein
MSETEHDATTPEDASQDRFDVILIDSGEMKISVIRVLFNYIGLGLKEAKECVDNAPLTVLFAASWDDATALRSALEAQGARTEIRPTTQSVEEIEEGLRYRPTEKPSNRSRLTSWDNVAVWLFVLVTICTFIGIGDLWRGNFAFQHYEEPLIFCFTFMLGYTIGPLIGQSIARWRIKVSGPKSALPFSCGYFVLVSAGSFIVISIIFDLIGVPQQYADRYTIAFGITMVLSVLSYRENRFTPEKRPKLDTGYPPRIGLGTNLRSLMAEAERIRNEPSGERTDPNNE